MSEVTLLVERVRSFVADHVEPIERQVVVGTRVMDDSLRAELQGAAKAAGVFGPLSPVEYGGLDLNTVELAAVLEAAGASLLGPLALNAWAPDDGNIHLLSHVANDDQRKAYLAPLASGAVRSAIAMAEPDPGAGSDPGMLKTSAHRVGEEWSINGAKHFCTGADGAAFFICVAATEGGATLFLVDANNPGVTVGRRMPTLDYTSAPGGHCEVEFADCRVPDSAVLGTVGAGLQLAQVRLAPSRLVFCMNWLGLAVRAHHMTMRHISVRTSFGSPIAEHGIAQGLVADSELDIAAARGIIRTAAEVIDEEGPNSSRSRHQASIAKVFVSEAVWRVLDRAVQLHGGLGVCDDHLVARFLVESRAFRIYEGPSEVLRTSIARRALRAHN